MKFQFAVSLTNDAGKVLFASQQSQVIPDDAAHYYDEFATKAMLVEAAKDLHIVAEHFCAERRAEHASEYEDSSPLTPEQETARVFARGCTYASDANGRVYTKEQFLNHLKGRSLEAQLTQPSPPQDGHGNIPTVEQFRDYLKNGTHPSFVEKLMGEFPDEEEE